MDVFNESIKYENKFFNIYSDNSRITDKNVVLDGTYTMKRIVSRFMEEDDIDESELRTDSESDYSDGDIDYSDGDDIPSSTPAGVVDGKRKLANGESFKRKRFASWQFRISKIKFDVEELKERRLKCKRFASSFDCKAPFRIGNILYKVDEPDIEKNIETIIDCAYYKVFPDDAITENVTKSSDEWSGGTFPPTRETLFKLDEKVYTLCGRYIYGHDEDYVTFKAKDMDEDDDEIRDFADEELLVPLLTDNKILLPVVTGFEAYDYDNGYAEDSNYAFYIYKGSVLVAFAIYR